MFSLIFSQSRLRVCLPVFLFSVSVFVSASSLHFCSVISCFTLSACPHASFLVSSVLLFPVITVNSTVVCWCLSGFPMPCLYTVLNECHQLSFISVCLPFFLHQVCMSGVWISVYVCFLSYVLCFLCLISLI